MGHSARRHKTYHFTEATQPSIFLFGSIFAVALALSTSASAEVPIETVALRPQADGAIKLHSAPDVSETGIMHSVSSSHDLGESALQAAPAATVVSANSILNGIFLRPSNSAARAVEHDGAANKESGSRKDATEAALALQNSNVPLRPEIIFPSDVPESEVSRVSLTFHSLVSESIRTSGGQLAREFLGTIAQSQQSHASHLRELGYFEEGDFESEMGTRVDAAIEAGPEPVRLEPSTTYTVVNGRVHAVNPTVVDAQMSATPSAPETAKIIGTTVIAGAGQSEVAAQNVGQSRPHSLAALDLPAEQVQEQLAKMSQPSGLASADSMAVVSDRVTVRGRVNLPEGYAKDRTILRMAGTGFQVQTDRSGAFELRDVPRETRFELLVWHLDGGLTRRFIPVVASGREKNIEVSLQQTRLTDSLAASFSQTQQMTLGGFCARADHESRTALLGGQVTVSAGGRMLQPFFYAESGFPSRQQLELTEDGRFCVFNIDASLIDVKISLLNGVRRQFAVHVEPSTFEHDLSFDLSESLYRKVSVLEPLDSRQVLELSAQGIRPDFGERGLRDWLLGSEVPVWTQVSRYLLQSDPAYAPIRPKSDDLQYFPGGQEIFEIRVAPDHSGAPWARVLVDRETLMTNSMLKQIQSLRTRIYQDQTSSVSVPALDSDAWADIVARNPDVPHLNSQDVGGVFLSVDTFALEHQAGDLVISMRDSWSGKSVCRMVRLEPSGHPKSSRYLRSACGSAPGQYALIIESRDGALVWSDIVRIRAGDVQTVTVLDSKF